MIILIIILSTLPFIYLFSVIPLIENAKFCLRFYNEIWSVLAFGPAGFTLPIIAIRFGLFND